MKKEINFNNNIIKVEYTPYQEHSGSGFLYIAGLLINKHQLESGCDSSLIQSEWVDFPIHEKELEEVLKRIGCENKDDFLIVDMATNFEYAKCIEDFLKGKDIIGFNTIGLLFEKIEENDCLTETKVFLGNSCNDLFISAANAIDGYGNSFTFRFNPYEEYGRYIVEEYYGGAENLPIDKLEAYFDYDNFGDDIQLDYYPIDDDSPETAGEYYCGKSYASNYNIGYEAIYSVFGSVEDLNSEYKERYFDYELYGKDIMINSGLVDEDNKIVDYEDFDIDLDYLEEELTEEAEEYCGSYGEYVPGTDKNNGII